MIIHGSIKNLSQTIYSFLADDRMLLHNKFTKWRMDLGDNMVETLSDFTQAHREIYGITNVPKYRSFQYRLLQRGLVTNVQLSRWKILESDLCTFCNIQPETATHLMWSCTEVQKLWLDVKSMIEQRYNIEINLSLSAVILNKIVTVRYHIANFMCLLCKHFIYTNRCLKNRLHFPIFKRVVNQIENVEKYIATKNNKIKIHNKKWNLVQDSDVQQFVLRYIDEM